MLLIDVRSVLCSSYLASMPPFHSRQPVLCDRERGQPLDTPGHFFAFWYYVLPNYVLAALMYSLLARFLLTFVLAPDSPNYIYRFFVRITDPAVRLVGFVTPRAIPAQVLLLFSVVWILMIRFVFFLVMANAGLAPTVKG